MVAGVLASAIESVGDYYACARLAGTSHMQYIIIYYTGCPKKNALSEPRLLPVLLSPQLGKQLISRANDELLP